MKITFQFDNDISRIFLDPETARDERYIELVREGKPLVEISSVGSKPKSLMLEFKQKPEDPAVVARHSLDCGYNKGLVCTCLLGIGGRVKENLSVHHDYCKFHNGSPCTCGTIVYATDKK